MSAQVLRSPSSSGSSDMSLATPTDSASSSSGTETFERLVRFNEYCVLIPELSTKSYKNVYKNVKHTPRIVTSTVDFSLPIPTTLPWRWPGNQQKEKEGNSPNVRSRGNSGTESISKSHEIQHVVLKVPYPIFRRKSTSSVPSPSGCPRPPCLVNRNNIPLTSATQLSQTFSNSSPEPSTTSSNRVYRSPRRSISLPPPPLDQGLETIPLRPCCPNCIAACEAELHQQVYVSTLPTLKEASCEPTPNTSQTHLPQDSGMNTSKHPEASNGEDWCTGLHFTKGALRLRRASLEHDRNSDHDIGSEGLLGALVRVDEVDRKRGTTPPASIRERNKPAPLLNLRHLSHLNETSGQKPKGGCSPTACSDGPDEDLFPLPSPKRSPASSPADSSTFLPSTQLLPSSEPRKLEAAIKAKMAEREKSRSLPSSPIVMTPPIQIKTIASKTSVSRFKPHTDDIVYDQSLPDPDALPPDSTILLNSPPESPQLRSSGSHHGSPTLDPLSLSPPLGILVSSSPPSRPTARRGSLSSVMRASVDILRGMSVAPQNTTYTGGVVI